MSSFVGHALAPVILYAATEPRGADSIDAPRPRLWLAALVLLALAPDADYLVRALILPGSPPIRVTHSFLGSLALPALVLLVLMAMGVRGRPLRLRGFQAASAGLSHVLLDLLVGVTPAALLWPFSSQTFRLPGGVLPSAGHLSFANPYLYRGILLELGVLLPILAMVRLARREGKQGAPGWIAIGALGLVSLGSMLISAALPR